MLILLSFWFFIVLCNFIFQIIIIDVLLVATNLITGFHVSAEGNSYNIFVIEAGWYSSIEGEIGTCDNRKKYVEGHLC